MKTTYYRVPLLGMLLSLLLSSHSFADSKDEPKVALMAALGDSMTSATFANTTAIESDQHKKSVVEGLMIFEDLLLRQGANRNTLSWSSGRDIDSHFIRLQSWMKNKEPDVGLEVQNLSVPGVTSSGLNKQATQIASLMKSGKYRYLKYVTISIGGNDICNSDQDGSSLTTPEQFVKNIQDTFRTLSEIEQSEPIFVFISSIPNAPSLGQDHFKSVDVGLGFTCEYLRNRVHNSCANLLTFKNEEEYAERVNVVVKQNQILNTLTSWAPTQFPKLKTYFSEAFFNFEVTPDMLGYDCFHPNKFGQETLGRITFEDQPFFK